MKTSLKVLFNILFLAIFLISKPVSAASVPIDQVPIQVRDAIPPNLLFILDDSGSMGRDYMPDSIGGRCANVNYANQWGPTSAGNAFLVITAQDVNNNIAFDIELTGTGFSGYIQEIEIDLGIGGDSNANWKRNPDSVTSTKGISNSDIDRDRENSNNDLFIEFEDNTFNIGDSFTLTRDVEKFGNNDASAFSSKGAGIRVRINNQWSEFSQFTSFSGSQSQARQPLKINTGNNPVYCKSHTYNTLYFNPNANYIVPVDANNTSLGSQDISSARSDGFSLNASGNQNSSLTDLTGWEYYEFDDANCSLPQDELVINCYRHTAVKDMDAAGQANFANWYTYYRTRIQTAKAGISIAFSDLEDNYRFGYGRINKSSTSVSGTSSTLETGCRTYSGIKSQFYEWLFTQNASGGTPLRRALDAAGQYFSSSEPYLNDTANSNSGSLSCRQNFTILMTDGFWNRSLPDSSPVNGLNADGSDTNAPTHINESGTLSFTYDAVAPYKDSYSSTLADVAMHYWKTDLRTGSGDDAINNVPVTPQNEAFWQHMVTLGIGLGVNGNIDPKTAFDAVTRNDNISWGNPASGEADKIDDLLHASLNSRGQYFSAQDPAEFINGLRASLDAVESAVFSGTSPAANSARTSGTRYVYRASFNSGDWSGNLIATEIDPDTGVISKTDAWAANFPAWNKRKIFSTGIQDAALSGIQFIWNNLDNSIRTALKPSSSSTDEEVQALIRYLAGDDSGEVKNSGNYRNRNSLLGDIVHSTPVFVGPPNPALHAYSSWPEAQAHKQFAISKASRPEMLYVGANDGMLHAFNGATGEEVFAYIPREFLTRESGNLKELASQDYEHQYFMDNEVLVTDVYIKGQWRTVLFGLPGRGGKSVFALDITDPINFSANNILWDISSPDIGNVISKPVVAKLESGDWVLILGNGYNSVSNKAQLIVIDIATGQKISIDTGVGSQLTPNGLAGPLVWDTSPTANRLYDAAYAGDLQGNVWEFDLSNISFTTSTPSITPVKLFTAINAQGVVQPITAGMAGREDENGQLWLNFGTGRFLSENDLIAFADNQPSVISLPVSESFDSSLSGWSFTGTGTDSTNGALRVDYGRTATKTYQFGENYRDTYVTVDFDLSVFGGWDTSGNSRDYFRVLINDALLTSDAVADFSNGKVQLQAKTDDTGELKIVFQTVATFNDEGALVDNLNIAATQGTSSTTDRFGSSRNGWSNGYLQNGEFRIRRDTQATKTYQLNPNESVSLSFDVRSLAGNRDSWENTDRVLVLVNNTQIDSWTNDINTRKNYPSLSANADGRLKITIDIDTSTDQEELALDNITLTRTLASTPGGSDNSGSNSGSVAASSTTTQTWYGIKASGSVGRADMTERVLESAGSTFMGIADVRVLPEARAGDMKNQSGWYIDLPASGERIVEKNIFRGRALFGTSLIPDITQCGSATDGYIMAIDPFTGASLGESYFDFNRDGVVDAQDEIVSDNVSRPGSGFSVGDSTSTPIFVDNQLVAQTSGNETVVIEVKDIQGVSGSSERVSWREIRD